MKRSPHTFKKAHYRPPGSFEPNTVSIAKTGRINLNRHYVQRYGLHKDMGAAMYWDADERKIAFILTETRQAGAFPLVLSPNGQTAYIVANQFFRANRLDATQYSDPYPFQVADANQLGITDDVGTAFVIDLKGR